MRFISDLHIHSHYSRATSPDMNIADLDHWADDKGIQVMGTGDFTHPLYFQEIKEKLEPAEPGLFQLKKEFKKKTLKGTFADTRFLLSVEISGIYSKAGRVRRIHNLVFAPDFKTAEAINTHLSLVGNLKSDGRPILGLDAEKLAEIVFNINPEAVIIPAHAWTPWFAIFGSMSGFDSIEECFGKYSKNIFAIETGLSSDPEMNWRLSKLDNLALISNSDSHSLPKIGREANIFDTKLSYQGIFDAIKSGIPNFRKNLKHKTQNIEPNFVATIEFFPEEGKYHFDGHRNCGVVFSPQDSKKHKNICPKCGRPLTIGVVNRVDQLADRQIKIEKNGNYRSFNNFVPYYNLITLDGIISEALETSAISKKAKAEYENLIKTFGSELKILLETEISDLEKSAHPKIAEAIKLVRGGKVKIEPGFDGEYGKISIFGKTKEIKKKSPKKSGKEPETQAKLF
ncbi:DNA helicase UvrD [Candidatus Wolfebacteria bacterium RIFCSPLOWO2_01_FULL_38_11]|nr:MAG: DNA helicase UvrD [Candidatus Wolfebacteria bacterium RIFCSPLOWO2_01_FULL_38_11]